MRYGLSRGGRDTSTASVSTSARVAAAASPEKTASASATASRRPAAPRTALGAAASPPYQSASGVRTASPAGGASYDGRNGLMSTSGLPSTTSAPRTTTRRARASTDSSATSDRPSADGRCGVRVARQPTFRPRPRGGRTLAATARLRPFVFSWKAKSSQTWLWRSRPSSAHASTTALSSTQTARAVGASSGCRGVPCTSR